MTFWKQVDRKPDLENLIDRAWYDDMLFEEGYSQGWHDAMKYEFAVREWVRGGGSGPMPQYTAGKPPRSRYERLRRHYQRMRDRGER